jgi:hypothetical protein
MHKLLRLFSTIIGIILDSFRGNKTLTTYALEPAKSTEFNIETQTLSQNTTNIDNDKATTKEMGKLLINGKQVDIPWKVISFVDEGGLTFPETHFSKRNTRSPKVVVLHWDECPDTPFMHKVLMQRGLSVHFGIDEDGTIYQFLDTKEVCWHARGVNTRSIGIEICNPVKLTYNDVYSSQNKQLRPVVSGDVVHGNTLDPYLGFYDIQLEAASVLCNALAENCEIPKTVPLDGNSKLKKAVDKTIQAGMFQGFVGHYHLTNTKTDPGYLDIEKLLKASE